MLIKLANSCKVVKENNSPSITELVSSKQGFELIALIPGPMHLTSGC